MNDLIDKCLYNWIGYGNYNGGIWFIGMEEGGAEIWREGIATLTLKESLKIRSEFSRCCDFRYVWEDSYGIPLNHFKKITTWHFICAFILAFLGEDVNETSVRNFLFEKKSLGPLDGSHFLCELLPLPKKLENDFPYTERWKDKQDYLREVVEKRFSIIAELIEKSAGAGFIVVYDKEAQNLIIEKWGNSFDKTKIYEFSNNGKRAQKYTLHTGNIGGKERTFIFTPFFGNGLISYKGIMNAVDAFHIKAENR